MKYPKFLNKKINLIAPSFGCTTEPYQSRLKKMIETFENKNFTIIKGKNIFSSIGFRSNTNVECAKEFIDAYNDNNFILSVGGGNLENEILDSIDFDNLLKSKPTYFMGYSDNTNLSFVITTILDTASIYGYNAPEFGSLEFDKSMKDQLELMQGKKLKFDSYDSFELNPIKNEDNPYLGYNLDTKSNIIFYPNKNIDITGRLIGGCIDCLTYLIGTKYDNVDNFLEKYKNDGFIWFLECCDLEAWNLKLALLQMKRRGWFKYLKGFFIGRPFKYNTDFIGLTMNDAIIDVLKDFNIPIIINADFGHLKPCIPLLCGSIGHIRGKDNKYTIEYLLK